MTGCAPRTCWIDDYRAFTVNEVAINWNAPLVWTAAFLHATTDRQDRYAIVDCPRRNVTLHPARRPVLGWVGMIAPVLREELNRELGEGGFDHLMPRLSLQL